jgi:hypothetical protein
VGSELNKGRLIPAFIFCLSPALSNRHHPSLTDCAATVNPINRTLQKFYLLTARPNPATIGHAGAKNLANCAKILSQLAGRVNRKIAHYKKEMA